MAYTYRVTDTGYELLNDGALYLVFPCDPLQAKSLAEKHLSLLQAPPKSQTALLGQEALDATPATSLPVAKARKVAQIEAFYNAKIEALTSSYPTSEVASWTLLLESANLFQSATPKTTSTSLTLAKEALVRSTGKLDQKSLDDFVAKEKTSLPLIQALADNIIAKGESYTQALIEYKGLRTFHSQKVQSLNTIPEVTLYSYS